MAVFAPELLAKDLHPNQCCRSQICVIFLKILKYSTTISKDSKKAMVLYLDSMFVFGIPPFALVLPGHVWHLCRILLGQNQSNVVARDQNRLMKELWGVQPICRFATNQLLDLTAVIIKNTQVGTDIHA